ncbi:molecular chaperone TorD family protein [bacterium]|jgi:TorA maturation chaperone TorD|nr:molecular chaperone TorD family protein [bacterium]MDB4807685.1 molecular chaperone TorD family protein [bacterium]MDC0287986.1 molecular chaperone TorD family protein [Rubripirellula sp.]
MTPLFGLGKLIDSEIENVESVATVYSLLARLWMQEVDAPFLEALAKEPLVSALAPLGLSLPTESVEQLAIEYCALFIGPKNALLPMQSVWQKTQLDSQSASSVAKFAELIGYVMPAPALWDHLGIQLDLMSHLLLATRSQKKRDKETDVAGEVTTAFFDRHLNWPSPLLLATSQRARLPLYRSLAEITQQFLQMESNVRSSASL